MSAPISTVAIDASTRVRIQTEGNKVSLSVLVGGIQMIKKDLEPNAASVIGSSLRHCAECAQENELLS
jgi:hypothetical protein